MSDANIIRTLSERCDLLEEENRQLKDEIESLLAGMREDVASLVERFRKTFRLTPSEARILARLTAPPYVKTKAMLGQCCGENYTDIKIADVFVCKLRRKLKPHGIAIDTVRSQGYAIDADNRAKLLALPGVGENT